MNSKATVLLFLASAFIAEGQSIFGVNLIRNGDAEEGAASPGTNAVVPVPEWSTTDVFTVNQYDVKYSSDLLHIVHDDAPGPVARGNNYFTGGPTSVDTTATQDIDVSPGAAEIDAGTVRYSLAGYFGGFRNQDDDALLIAQFFASDDALLGTNSVGAVTPDDRPFDPNNPSRHQNCLLSRKTAGLLPSGTRRIHLILMMRELTAGTYNDGYADNLSLVLVTPTIGASGLRINKTGNDLIVQWPANLTGFTLQSTDMLQLPVIWTPLTNPVTALGSNLVEFITSDRPRQFFRLSFP